jgi:putative spermidine/putrescine transport system ATP-binding protein
LWVWTWHEAYLLVTSEPILSKVSGVSSTVIVSIKGLSRSFGDVRAVAGVDLDIYEGEFITLLGPSGSGKTTVLRMIAGFEKPDSGTIDLAGKDVSQLPPYERDVNTVFQDYALFPHMNVISNIEYGLKVKGVAKEECSARALEALKQVRLEGYGERKPSQLSGGQRQRVALARALVNRPSVLLLDEPLGALDLKLREQMQIELKELQREVGITFIFVTHDQEEALTMSDRIAVFNNGKIEQLGTPREIYENPVSSFVSEFVGQTNKIVMDGTRINIRPESVSVSKSKASGNRSLPGNLRDVIFVGAITRYLVDTSCGPVISVVPEGDLKVGDPVTVSWEKEKEFLVH